MTGSTNYGYWSGVGCLRLFVPREQDENNHHSFRVDLQSTYEWYRALQDHIFDPEVDFATEPLEDPGVDAHREHALQLLESTAKPVPCRKYTGAYAEAFRCFARQEAGQTLGWRFLRQVIFGALHKKEAMLAPAYNSHHRAYLLIMGQVGGREVVRNVRNLDACTRDELSEVMAGVKERGWRDIVWIKNQDADFPTAIQEETVRILHWGFSDVWCGSRGGLLQ